MLLRLLCLLKLLSQLFQLAADLLNQAVGTVGGDAKLFELLMDAGIFLLHLIAGSAGFLIAEGQSLVLGGVGDFILLTGFLLCLHRQQLGLQLDDILSGLLHLGVLGLHPTAQRLDAAAQCFNLLPSGEQSGAFCRRASGQGTACVDQLAIQRHHAEAIGIALGDLHRRVDILRHHDPAEQIFDDAAIARLTADQPGRLRHKAFHLFDAVRQQLLRLDEIERQKGCSACLGIF